MNEHPILFSNEMVKAILDGRKSMTRRVIKPQPTITELCNPAHGWYDTYNYKSHEMLSLDDFLKLCPYGTPGDHLWVKETFAYDKDDKGNRGGVAYKSDGSGIRVTVRDFDTGERYELPWKPSIFMPRWASRITLEVVSVRVERVQDISRDDAILEGLYSFTSNLGAKNSSPVRFYCANKGCEGGYMNPVEAFENLWDAINGKRGYSFESNPFVWVVEFKKI